MTETEAIVVEFVAVPEYVAIARRVAEVVTVRAGMDAARCEELQIAVSEVCNRLVSAAQTAAGERAALRLRFWIEAERVVAEIGSSGEPMRRALAALLADDFALFLMRRLVDRTASVENGGELALRLEKSCREQPLP